MRKIWCLPTILNPNIILFSFKLTVSTFKVFIKIVMFDMNRLDIMHLKNKCWRSSSRTFSLDIVRINTLTLILENKGKGEVTFITFNTDKKNNINYELKIIHDWSKKSLKIPMGGNHNPYIEEEQTAQWPKEKVQKDKQRSTKHTHKAKDRITRPH